MFILFIVFFLALGSGVSLEATNDYSPDFLVKVDYLVSIINNEATSDDLRLDARFALARAYEVGDHCNSYPEEAIKMYESIMNDSSASLKMKLHVRLYCAYVIGNFHYYTLWCTRNSFKPDTPKAIRLIKGVIDDPMADTSKKELARYYLACFLGGFWGDGEKKDKKKAIQLYETIIKDKIISQSSFKEHFYLAELLLDAMPFEIILTKSQLKKHDGLQMIDRYRMGSFSDIVWMQNVSKLRLAQLYLWGKVRYPDRALTLCNEVIENRESSPRHQAYAKSFIADAMILKDNKSLESRRKAIDIYREILRNGGLSKEEKKYMQQRLKLLVD